MPSDGGNIAANAKFNPIWQQFAENNQAKFVFIDNSKRGSGAVIEKQKILSSNILIISGGNTFKLLDNLRQSGLDKAVIEFWQKDNVVLSGFSAGAIVLAPKIDVASQPSGIDPTDMSDENIVGITDLAGLGILDFEVWPHYYEDSDKETLEKYKDTCSDEVKTIGDNEIVVIDR